MILSARWVPRMLTDAQKADRAETSASLLTLFSDNPENFLSRFVTVDETWPHHFDPENKAQSMAWKHVTSPPHRKFRVFASASKVMAAIFWDSEGIALIDYLEHGRTITGTYYADLIGKYRAALKEKRRREVAMLCVVSSGPCTFSYVITSTVPSKMQVLNCSTTHCIGQTCDSDLCFVPKLEDFMKGRKFADDDDVICTARDWLEDQDQEFFYNGIRALENCWTECISVEGDYVAK